MPQMFNLQRLILASAAFAIMVMASSTAWADPIVITVGNPGNQNTDNVLFNNGSLVHSGLLVQGDFNGSGAIEIALHEQAGVNKAPVVEQHVVRILIPGVSDGDNDWVGPRGRRGHYHDRER